MSVAVLGGKGDESGERATRMTRKLEPMDYRNAAIRELNINM
jgi:hypothetical protein